MTGDKKRPLTPAELSQGFDPLASYKFPKLPEIKSPAEYVVEALASSIRHFEASLNSDQEIGFRWVSFGQSEVFHFEGLRVLGGQLLEFRGVSDNERTVRLIQHFTQISVLLVALRKRTDQPKRFGFVHPNDPRDGPND